MRGPPEMRRDARQGAPNRNAKPPRLYDNKYSRPAAFARFRLGNTAAPLEACWYAVTADSLVLGTFGTRREAALALSGVRP
jgi:hypothetical protein